MSAYVDDMLKLAAVRNGTRTVRGRWSHLLADSSDELHQFAATLGLKPAWVQKPATALEHYDITAGKRALALQLGAIPITYGEGAHLTRCKRAGVPFDISLLRSDPDRFNAELVRARAALGGQDPPAGGPRRLQLQRSAGWRMPSNGVSVAAPTRWANPFRPARRTPAANEAVVERYREYLAANPALLDAARVELAGKDLGCWCPPHFACHADVLLAIANPPLEPADPHPAAPLSAPAAEDRRDQHPRHPPRFHRPARDRGCAHRRNRHPPPGPAA